MPSLTPEQVAQAYIGPYAGYFKQYEDLKKQQEEQRRLEIDAAKKKRAEQASALMNLNKTMSTAHLGTGTQFDEAFQQKAQDYYNKWTSGEGAELFKNDQSAWEMGQQQDANSLLASKANYEKGVNLLDQNLKQISSKYNNALLNSQAKNALINRILYKNNGKYPDFLTLEDQDLGDLLEGRINADGTDAKTPLEQRLNKTLYFDKDLLGEHVANTYKSQKPNKVNVEAMNGKMPTVLTGNIGIFDRVDPKTKSVVTDTVPVTLKNGEKADVLSDRALSYIYRNPDLKIDLAHFENQILNNPENSKIKEQMDDDDWTKLLATQYVKYKFPAEQTIKEEVNDVKQKQLENYRWFLNYNKEKKASDKPKYIDLVSASLKPGVPKGAIKVANSNVLKLKNPNLQGVNYDELYDITDVVGKYDFKNRSNFPVRVLKDVKTGKVYITSKPYVSSAGNPVEPKKDLNTLTTNPSELQEIDPKDVQTWLRLQNPQDLGHETLEDFTNYFPSGTVANPTPGTSVKPANAGVSASESTKIANIDWDAAVNDASKKLLQSTK